MFKIFDWPRTIEKPGFYEITGLHQTPGLNKVGHTLTGFTGLAMMINPWFAYYSIVNRVVVLSVWYVCPQWTLGDIGATWLISQFFLGLLIGVAADKHLNLYGWLLRRRTTVKIATDWVEIHGVRYPQTEANSVHFVTTSDAVRMENGKGESLTMGSVQESCCLRVAYGRSNTAIVATFLKPEHASLFALACNAAMQLPPPMGPRGFDVMNVIPLPDDETRPQAVPVKARVRR